METFDNISTFEDAQLFDTLLDDVRIPYSCWLLADVNIVKFSTIW